MIDKTKNNVRLLRSNNFVLKKDIASATKIGAGRLRSIENGAEPIHREIISLALYYDVDPQEIFPYLTDKENEAIRTEIQEKKIFKEFQIEMELNVSNRTEEIQQEKERQELAHDEEKREQKIKRRESKRRIKQLEEQLKLESGSVLREIIFPEDFQEAGITILQGFIALVRKKYHDQDVSISIEQDGLSVVLKVYGENGIIEELEEFLDKYSLVVVGKQDIETLTQDPAQIMHLKNQLSIAKLQLEHQREMNVFLNKSYEPRISSLEEQNQWLKESLSLGLASERTQLTAMLEIIKNDHKIHPLATSLVEEVEGLKHGKGSKEKANSVLSEIAEMALKDGVGKGAAEAIKKLIAWAADQIQSI